MIQKNTKLYSLSHSKSILKSSLKLYASKEKDLKEEDKQSIQHILRNLNQAILEKDREKADAEARLAETFSNQYLKKTLFTHAKELVTAILIALTIAIVVRSMWFELYEIPTGSMRPTFKEQDHLTVSKTTFGINIPLYTDHFYFDPSLVKRNGIIIWSGDQIPHLDSEANFMGIPYTKRFIKRCMGKPGDTLYFYGGQIYGIDQEGNDLKEVRDNQLLSKIEHIPFTHFEGRPSYINDPLTHTTRQVLFHLIGKTIGRIRFLRSEMKGEIFDGKSWIPDNPEAQKSPHLAIKTYSDFWGIRNFGISRILTKAQAQKFAASSFKSLPDASLYLEIRHTPSLSPSSLLLSPQFGAKMTGYSTVLPLKDAHLQALMNTMYTCRFIVQGEKAWQYRAEQKKSGPHPTSPSFKGIPDGTYEFYYGIAYQIGWGGVAYELPKDHPLYQISPKNIQFLYNMGIEMSTLFEPNSDYPFLFPSRYTYFREGDLYTMGGILMGKEDQTLKGFNESEKKRQNESSSESRYIAFQDYGPPVNAEGEIDKNFLKTFGYTLPENRYLALGDNHAMSQDSRWFGPIPSENLQGTPSLIIWPPGHRFGQPLQPPYPIFVLPRLIVWFLACFVLAVWFLFHRHRKKQFAWLNDRSSL